MYGENGPSIKVEVFDFDDDDSIPEPLGFAEVLLKDIEPSLMQVNLAGSQTIARTGSGK